MHTIVFDVTLVCTCIVSRPENRYDYHIVITLETGDNNERYPLVLHNEDGIKQLKLTDLRHIITDLFCKARSVQKTTILDEVSIWERYESCLMLRCLERNWAVYSSRSVMLNISGCCQ